MLCYRKLATSKYIQIVFPIGGMKRSNTQIHHHKDEEKKLFQYIMLNQQLTKQQIINQTTILNVWRSHDPILGHFLTFVNKNKKISQPGLFKKMQLFFLLKRCMHHSVIFPFICLVIHPDIHLVMHPTIRLVIRPVKYPSGDPYSHLIRVIRARVLPSLTVQFLYPTGFITVRELQFFDMKIFGKICSSSNCLSRTCKEMLSLSK